MKLKTAFIICCILCLLFGCGDAPSSDQSENYSEDTEWSLAEKQEEYADGYEDGAEEAYSQFKDGIDAAFEAGKISERVYYDLCDEGRDCVSYETFGEGYSSGRNNGFDDTRDALQDLYWGYYKQGIISEAAASYIESFT